MMTDEEWRRKVLANTPTPMPEDCEEIQPEQVNIGDRLVGKRSGAEYTVEDVGVGLLQMPLLVVRDAKGNRVEHDTSLAQHTLWRRRK